MSTPRLSHLGIAVPAHAEVLAFWRDLLGLPLEHSEHVASDGVSVAMLRLGAGGGAVELLQPDGPETPVGRFLEKRGAGLHHVAFEVDDIVELLARMRAAGVRLIDEQPRKGAHDTTVAFVHPKSTGGVLVELVQART
ncbi:MAG: methylmalonyl-CoA epimerase [Planctomycetes bacterium]|nr:methylmalonyl-CoA epimerase [Planctomycetota bacterium]